MGPESISPKEILRILEKAAGKEAVPVADLKEFERRIAPYISQNGKITLGSFSRNEETLLSVVLQYSFQSGVVDTQFFATAQVVHDWLSKFIPPKEVQKLSSRWERGDTFHARFEELRKGI